MSAGATRTHRSSTYHEYIYILYWRLKSRHILYTTAEPSSGI
jgi:hypothetical protein